MCYYLVVLLVHISNDKSYIYVGEVVLQSRFNIIKFEVASTVKIFSDAISKVSQPAGFIVIFENFELISENSKLVWTIQNFKMQLFKSVNELIFH